jgi:hypothetical protein
VLRELLLGDNHDLNWASLPPVLANCQVRATRLVCCGWPGMRTHSSQRARRVLPQCPATHLRVCVRACVCVCLQALRKLEVRRVRNRPPPDVQELLRRQQQQQQQQQHHLQILL